MIQQRIKFLFFGSLLIVGQIFVQPVSAVDLNLSVPTLDSGTVTVPLNTNLPDGAEPVEYTLPIRDDLSGDLTSYGSLETIIDDSLFDNALICVDHSDPHPQPIPSETNSLFWRLTDRDGTSLDLGLASTNPDDVVYTLPDAPTAGDFLIRPADSVST